MDNEYITIPVKELTKLLNIRREHYKICELFAIPVEKRSEEWVGQGIIDRIKQYMTSYNIRKSLSEKESGAAFRDSIKPDISDPVLTDANRQE